MRALVFAFLCLAPISQSGCLGDFSTREDAAPEPDVSRLVRWEDSASNLTANTPTWSIGDYWRERVLAKESNGSEYSATKTVVAIENVEIPDGVYRAYRLESKTPEGETLSKWFSTTDLALLRTRLEDEKAEVVYNYDYPCPQFAWPMKVGAGWSSSCPHTQTVRGSALTTSASAQGNGTYRVVSVDSLALAWGPTDAFRVEARIPPSATQPVWLWYAPQACGPVLSVTQTGNATVETEVVAYDCTSRDSAGASGGTG